jgi:hypothetical protein
MADPHLIFGLPPSPWRVMILAVLVLLVFARLGTR